MWYSPSLSELLKDKKYPILSKNHKSQTVEKQIIKGLSLAVK